ncbi:MAG: leucine-rich repeat protein [Bacteroidales bacterium]|nr:leucine-rich repeat protein [Bacteroidales bacterium]
MKRQMTLRSFLVVICLLLGLSLHAKSRTIHVETPGTLSTYIPSNEKYSITSLTLTGDLNGTDIAFIGEMATWDPYGHYTNGSLSTLDLSGANIVKGGDPYYGSYYSSDDTIGYRMFTSPHLTSISIPNSVRWIDSEAFDGDYLLKKVIIGNSVTSIENKTFYQCGALTSVTLGNSITTIGESAFYGCEGLTSVTIPNSVTTIAYAAFAGCSGLTSVTIDNSVTSIDYGAFEYCNKLTSVNLGNSVTSIGSRSFSGCTALTSVTIPNSVTSIGGSAFSGCSGLTSVTIPNSVTSIGYAAFSRCSGLTSVTIPNSVTSIGYYVFSDCLGLTSVTLGNSLTSIGDFAFRNCTGLTSVTIPNSVTSIGASAFSGCNGLTSVSIPNSVNFMGDDVFVGCSELTSITISNTLTSIGNNAFKGCSKLTSSVTIPNSVTSIGSSAFSGCIGLTSITIGNSVTSIGTGAFSSCAALTSIVSSNPEPPVASEATFENVGANKCKIYVPVGSKQKYEEAIGWDKFSNIIESSDLGTINIVLSISSGEAGAIELIMRKGDIFTFKVVPSTGWKINTVMYNALDVTSQLDAQNQFTTPMLEANSTIRISFENTLSSVDQVETSNIKLFSEGEFIVIEGGEPGETISVYTESGSLYQTMTLTDNILRINAPRGHIYLIKIAGKSFKVAL